MVGLNHRTAPVRLRETLAFSDQAAEQALLAFKQRFPSSEVVIISTCNRVELYAAASGTAPPTTDELVEFLADNRGVASAEAGGSIYRMQQQAVVEHLFNVVSSLRCGW